MDAGLNEFDGDRIQDLRRTGLDDDMLVWDRVVRIGHWSLVLLVAVAAFTGFFPAPETFDVHIIAGTAIAFVIVVRIVWGFAGSTYARFRSFVCSPSTTIQHAKEIAAGHGEANIGHNPLAGLMILALLATLVASVVTGTIALGGVYKDGPAATLASYALGDEVKELHEVLAFALLGLITLHVAGAVFESLRTRENLVRSMVTGMKRRRHERVRETPPATSRPLLAFAVTSAVSLSLAAAITHLSLRPAAGVPTALIPAVVNKECGACHAVYHPSIAPSSTWSAIISGLEDHFGENASLDDPALSEIGRYLESNAASFFDTKPANMLRQPSRKESLRITATSGWQNLHRDVPEALFKLTKVGGKLNCTKCHADAENGRFSPREIAVPN